MENNYVPFIEFIYFTLLKKKKIIKERKNNLRERK